MALPPPYLTLAKVLPDVDETDGYSYQAQSIIRMLEKRGYTVALSAAVDPERIPKGVLAPEHIICEGDVISGAEAHECLPPGSVVAWTADRNPATRNRLRLHDDGRWMPAVSGSRTSRYEVVHLLRPVTRTTEATCG